MIPNHRRSLLLKVVWRGIAVAHTDSAKPVERSAASVDTLNHHDTSKATVSAAVKAQATAHIPAAATALDTAHS